jgi:hypothetical protein
MPDRPASLYRIGFQENKGRRASPMSLLKSKPKYLDGQGRKRDVTS